MSNPLKILWYINASDGRYPWKSAWLKDPQVAGRYAPDTHRLRRLANTLDRLGYYGALQTGAPWITSSSLIPFTERLRFLIPIYPGVFPPLVLAEQARAFDLYSNGRLLFNQINGTEFILPQLGVEIADTAQRYEASAEYWTLFKRLYQGDYSPVAGKYFSFPGGNRQAGGAPPIQDPYTPIWGTGASPPGVLHAGQVLDYYLTYLHHPRVLKPQFDQVRQAAAANGREVGFGVLAGVIVRETEDEAWAHARWLLEQTGVEAIVNGINQRLNSREGRSGLDSLSSGDPQIQGRIDALRAGRLPERELLEIAPNLWSGVINYASLDVEGRQGRGTYIVGNPRQVADRLQELQETLGVDAFILSGWPLIDEAERTAELLFPLLNLDLSTPRLRSR